MLATTSNQHSLSRQADCQNGSTRLGNSRHSFLAEITAKVNNTSGLHDKQCQIQQRTPFQTQHQPQKLSSPILTPISISILDRRLSFAGPSIILSTITLSLLSNLSLVPAPITTLILAVILRVTLSLTLLLQAFLSPQTQKMERLWDAVFKNREPVAYTSNTTTVPEETRYPFDPQGFAWPSFKAILAPYNIQIKSTKDDEVRRAILLSSHNMNLAEPSTNGKATTRSEATKEGKTADKSKSVQKTETTDDSESSCQSPQKLQSAGSSAPRSLLHCDRTSKQLKALVRRFLDMRNSDIPIMDIKEL
jgi:hypothetical protein